MTESIDEKECCLVEIELVTLSLVNTTFVVDPSEVPVVGVVLCTLESSVVIEALGCSVVSELVESTDV